MRDLFGDLAIEALEEDPKEPGVFMKARKPLDYEKRTPELALYSMIAGRRVHSVNPLRRRAFVAVKGARRAYQQAVPEPARQRVNRVLGRR
jgi:hypothetical protein